jgi:hypothetical protein
MKKTFWSWHAFGHMHLLAVSDIQKALISGNLADVLV